MEKLSAVIITLNEEKNIARCLDSLKDVVDETVVVDSGSSDKTKEICESYANVRFLYKEWLGYAEQKNYGNTQASFEYILSIDADEELSNVLKAQIISAKKNLDGIYYFDRLTNYCGSWIRHSDWFPDPQKRIFPRSDCFWSPSKVHETVECKNPKIKLTKLSGVLNHYSFYSIFDHIDRINKYSNLGAEDVIRKGKKFLIPSALINGGFRFFKAYFLKLGFLDGFHGFCVCALSGFAVFLKYLKAAQLQNAKKKSG